MPNYQFTDEELIAKFQNGDVKAYNQLVYRYKDRLINFVYRFMNDIDKSEDIVQDTLLKVYTHCQSYKEIAKFSTWLYTIAGNLARTELRKIKRRKTFTLTDLKRDNREYEIPHIDDPSESYDSSNFESDLQRALDLLPDDFRTMVILRDIQELSYEDISKIVEVPLGTVKSRINRGRLKLQHLLKKRRY
ncbi:MAG: sigma-70 family RNA polymerase sigma factor [Candidatus Marinimicrobia bacterium]|nr:sigma-70 family RNA polymerase sigma factor [Candidatus Neomarinimicrobiota bacterium]MBL7023466.1 sigma-70 family RNA polymerase sigma factor [Candidatus Neomarinimicrobiota bacterium]MBL7109279.1 sigma-70 family RNA polymerase sigma factor [Candidatus Neomarinimicrobiota bacterium]